MHDLTKQIGLSTIRNTSVIPPKINDGIPFTYPHNSLPPSFVEKKKAKVLFDYEASEPSEISVSANQVNINLLRKILNQISFVDHHNSNSSK